MLPPVISEAGDPVIRADGYFSVNTTGFIYFDFPDINGDLYDPSDIDITITDPNLNTVVSATELDKLDVGQYVYEWEITGSATEGVYTLLVQYTVHTSSGSSTESFTKTFVVGEQPSDETSDAMLAMASYMQTQLGRAQRIPVFDEVGRLNNARTVAEYNFPQWNQTSGVKVRVNGVLKESGYYVDYWNGKVQFSNPLTEIDQVTTSYNFRWFKTAEIYRFIEQGVEIVNVYPPASTYTVVTLPLRFGIVALHAAAVEAFRALMAELAWQEPVKVFGGPERADKAFNYFDTVKKNLEGQLEKELEAKLKQPYVGLTKTVTVPEYTLPGGRSRWFRYLFKGSS